MSIYIPASKISAVCDRNPYTISDVAMIELIESYDKRLYTKLSNSYNAEINVWKSNVELIREQFPDIQVDTNSTYLEQYNQLQSHLQVESWLNQQDTDEIDESEIPVITSIVTQETNEYQEFKKSNSQMVESITSSKNISVNVLQNVPIHIARHIIMARGTQQESNVFKLLQEKLGHDNVVKDNAHLTRLLKVNGKNLKIGGRVDVILYNDRTPIGVIEIKTRKTSLFGREKLEQLKYEIDQLACYWYITQLKKYYICEFFNGEIELHEFSQAELSKSWDAIVTELTKFTTKYSQLEQQPESKSAITMMHAATNIK